MSRIDPVEFVLMGAIFWPLFAAPAALLSAPIAYLGRRRLKLKDAEALLGLSLPYCVWFAHHHVVPKGPANLFSEPVLLGLTVPLAVALRVALGAGPQRRATSAALILLLCLAGAAIHAWTPHSAMTW